jgi:hypothetical protein
MNTFFVLVNLAMQALTTKFDEHSRKDQALIDSQKQALSEKETALQVCVQLSSVQHCCKALHKIIDRQAITKGTTC